MKSTGTSTRAILVAILICTIVVSGVIALVLSIVDWKSVFLPSDSKYGMVFDAGSSHTSMYIYQWPADKENDTGIVNQISRCTSPGKGISSYVSNPPGAGASLKSCLDEAMKIIPENKQKETPVLLGATAGMRLLQKQNISATEMIFQEVTKVIQQYPMDFQGARILTGNEEGSLGWITVNYLLQTFVSYSFKGQWIRPSPGQILGAMDLGGASTQLTFYPTVPINDKSTEMIFRLYGYNYTVYTHSYLCYGKDQAVMMLLANVIESQAPNTTIYHPCYPPGYTDNISLALLYGSPCVKIPAQGFTAPYVTVKGIGSPGACRNMLKTIFNFSACGTNQDCTFDDIYQPPVAGKFYAFSAFFYTFSFLNLTDGQPLSTANDTIWNFCLRDWNTLKAAYPLEGRDYLLNYCGTGFYILTLLVDGYKFDDKTWKNIIFAKQAGNAEIGWTLGYMLNLTNKIPSDAPTEIIGRSRSLWAASLFFIVLSIFAALVVISILLGTRNTA